MRRTPAVGDENSHKALDTDVEDLWRNCTLLKAEIVAALRLNIGIISGNYVEDDFVLTQGEECGKLFGEDQPESFLLNRGNMVWVPHTICQPDEKRWLHPELFDAKSLWEEMGNIRDREKRSPS